MLSSDILNFLAILLSKVTLQATDPNLEQNAALIAKARIELLAALDAIEKRDT